MQTVNTILGICCNWFCVGADVFHIEQTNGKLKAVRMITAICLKAIALSSVEVKPDGNWRMEQVKFRRLKSGKHAQ